MTTSGVTAFSLTARDLISSALVDAGVVALGVTPKAKEMAECLRRLNMMLKSWQIEGLVWKDETITVSVTGGDAATTLPATVRSVSGVRYIDSATNHRTLGRWERDEYRILPNKAASGTPTIFHFDRQRDAAVLYLWPVPSGDCELSIDAGQMIETVTNEAETLDVPEEWSETVMKCIAARCARIFLGQTPQDLFAEAKMLETAMLDQARPASYMLGPYV